MMMKNSMQAEEQSILAKRITLVTFILTILLAILTLFFIPAEDKTPIDNYMMPLTALLAGYSYYLVRKGNFLTGIYFLLGGIFAVSLIYPLFADNIAWQTATSMLLLTTGTAIYTMSRSSALRVLAWALLVAVAIILIDTFTGNTSSAPATPSSIIITVLLVLIYLLLIFNRFPTFPLRVKLLILSLGAGLVSILLVGFVTSISTRQTLVDQTYSALASAAKQAVEEIDTYIQYNMDTISAEAQDPRVVEFLQSSFEEQRLNQDAMVALLNAFAKRDPEHIISYTLIHRNDGLVVADGEEFNIGFSEADQDYFAIPRFSDSPFVSPARYSTNSSNHEFHIGVPVKDENGNFLGVLSAHFRSIVFNEILANNNELAGEGSYGILLDEYSIILAHGVNPDWVSHTLLRPGPETFAVLQDENRILRSIGGANISLDMPDFANKLQNVAQQSPYFTSTDPAWGAPVEVGFAKSKNTALRLVYVQPQSIALAAVTQQQRVTVTAGIITGLVLLVLVFLVSRTITNPLIKLASVAEDIASGNLSARAQYEIDDELGTLAKAFNRMTSQLQDTLGGLERRVAERTVDLETASLLSEQRAQDLQSISEVSRTISTEQRLDILLPLITRLVSERFDFYHVGIFFVDEARRYAYLQAANSEGGQRMLARGHRLELGTGLVGTVAQTGRPRITLDVGADASFFNNPDLPDTHSEMALPLNVRGTTIGALDVQSIKSGAFTEGDANTLGILADQIAIAIENARLFSQTQQAREEAEELYAQVLNREWSAFVRQEEKIGYQKTAFGGRRISKPVDTDEIREALKNGQVVVVEGTERNEHPSIVVPIKLRDKTVGVLNIKAPSKARRWSRDEINLAQAVSDRLALALDNVRLLQESQRRAAKEAKIGEVTAKIGASINMRSVLQTAVEELGRALPGSDVMIQFQADEEN